MPFGSLLKKKKTKESASGQGTTSSTTTHANAAKTLSPVPSKQSEASDSVTTSATLVASPSDGTKSPIKSRQEESTDTATINTADTTTNTSVPSAAIRAPSESKGESAREGAGAGAGAGASAASTNTNTETNPTASRMSRIEPRQTKGKYNLADFSFERTLGTGSFGRVHLVQSKHNQRFYAIKVLKKLQVVKMKQVEHTNDERKMLQQVKHPFLITLWGTFQDSKNLYMVMDFVEGGELFSLLRKSQVGRFLPSLRFVRVCFPNCH
jgi:protein kinase A